MSALLTWAFGRLPIGWLQLAHNKARLAAAVAGVAFANLLVFMQLGVLGALHGTISAPYSLFDADIMLSSQDANTISDGGNIARTRLFEALSVPGVAEGATLMIGKLDWTLPDGSTSTLQIYGVDVGQPRFLGDAVRSQVAALRLENAVLLDSATRGVSKSVFAGLSEGNRRVFEINGLSLTAVGTLALGGGFSADGSLVASDQTFLRLFPRRSSGAPSHILLRTDPGVSVRVVIDRLRAALPQDSVKVRSLPDAAQADLKYQTTERPVGIIFGFGVLIGVLVGLVIVYQVLSTDVADHLREYATFKAMGYDQPFFLGIVFEEALVLAVFGFVPGVVVSLLLYSGLRTATSLPIEMDVPRATIVFLGTLLACSLSGAVATRRLAAADPADLF